MAKTLSFTDTSPQTVKIGDTTTSFTLICGNDNVATDLTNATSITVKLGNASGYLKSTAVDPAKLTDPTTGQVTVKFNADLMTSLPAGSYAIEVWVVDSTGTSIYPSDGSTGFTITNNIQSANGSTITTITFDDFVKAMNKAASTIAKGDKGEKGDTGTVDNAGLTAAPAFVGLQTQVDNSAVGTNLLLDSQTQTRKPSWLTPSVGWIDDWGTYLGSNIFRTSYAFSNARYRYKDLLDRGVINTTDDFTYSIYFRVVGEDPAGMSYAYISFYSNATTKSSFVPLQITSLKEGQWARIVVPIKFIDIEYDPTNDYGQSIRVEVSADPKVAGAHYEFAAPKLEKGSVATDWCPNPSEILTQSDYAKLQAAIVSLGGHLS
ncbi:hypothetical protein DA076_05855 [Lactiplantibacillus plantarum]|uniref:collagen-like protein n=1 Tax=Lactiplantibacillus plantarum TaxID=1590 RepID=UPI000D204EDF|nr:collagen-like protein [Lactiplantibacillus plantarum]AVW07272.1 hypothetical protein DA076_05855 [Lactiplantibacillus plantarum]